MGTFIMTCFLDMTGTLSVVIWQKKKKCRVQVFEAQTYLQQTHKQVVKPREEVSKLELLMEIKSMELTSHLREGEKLCL